MAEGNYINYYNDTYTYGNSYTDNGNGTYTINNPTTINKINWRLNYSNIDNKYFCLNVTDATCSVLLYMDITSNTYMHYYSSEKNYKYANSFTWDGSKYILKDGIEQIWDFSVNSATEKINNAHYTCANTSGNCTSLLYIYYFSGGSYYFINLSNGKGIEDAISEMLNSDNVNAKNSSIKIAIDSWYKHYLLDYSSYLEETIFCNDRSISSLGGFNPNGGNGDLRFQQYYVSNDLSCTNETDKFSVANNKAKLDFSIGLMSTPEMNILTNDNIRRTGKYYWTMTPFESHNGSAIVRYIYQTGSMTSFEDGVNNSFGIRPVISLRPGVEYISGDGSKANPYIMDAPPIYNNIVKNTSNASKTFGKSIAKNSFETITTVANIDVPSDAIDSWDASVNKNGSVMAWYTDRDNNGLYELYLGQLGGVRANADSSYAFQNFVNAYLIDLRNYKTDDATTMKNMFENSGYTTSTFTILGLSNFKILGVTSMQDMFSHTGYVATSCSLGNLSRWNVSNVEAMDNMFSYTCNASSSFDIGDLGNWDTSHVSNMKYMFFHTGESATTWNIGSIKIYASNTSYMFNQSRSANCTLNMYSNPSNYTNMFSSTSISNGGITVNYTNDVIDIDNIIATKSYNSNVIKGSLLN